MGRFLNNGAVSIIIIIIIIFYPFLKFPVAYSGGRGHLPPSGLQKGEIEVGEEFFPYMKHFSLISDLISESTLDIYFFFC